VNAPRQRKVSSSSTRACTGVNAVAAGSMFVFHGKHKAVLINYPTPEQLEVLHLSHTTP